MGAEGLKILLSRLDAFDYEGEVRAIVSSNANYLADLQAEQLATGKNSKGENIYPLYSPFTIAEKKKHGVGLGGVTDRVTYFDKGGLYASLYATVEGDKFSIKSESFKFKKMVQRSGISVVGLDLEMRRRFIEEITIPQFKRRFTQKTGIEFKI